MGRSARSIRIAVVLVTAVALGWAASAARAAAPDDHGYWWRLNGGGLGGTSPHVADGGLWVAADPLGAQAVSAIRLQVPDGHEVDSLVLVEDSRTGTPALQACPVAGDWSPPENDPGTWDQRPEGDCDAAVPGTEGAGDVVTWVFPVGSMVDDGVLDVAIVPAPDSNFSVTFAPVDEGTVVTEETQDASFDFLTPTTSQSEETGSTPPAPTSEQTTPPPASEPTRRAPAPATSPPTTSTPVQAVPSPTTTVQPIAAGPVDALDDAGSRAPVALLLVLAVLGSWAWRTRQVVLASAAHPLAGEPFTAGAPALAAEGLLREDADT